MQCATLIITGASASQLGFALSKEQSQYIASAPSYIESTVSYFDAEQRAIVAAIADAIIPRDETPGAVDAGVPRYIELMVADWFNDEEQAIFNAGLEDLQTRVPGEYGEQFVALAKDRQVKILEQLEDAAAESSWYEFGNVLRAFVSDAPFICQIKELTVWGFFTSEIGSTQVLRHDPMPMEFDGDYPLAPDDSTWSGGLTA
ncbi:MAG: gluconate 2-dehydrogenase subunit 3 family protein [Halioglobus sp.]